ncbi:MAG: Uncharacterised protein [Candidatus Poseidoniaceae archaeon]|nr:MAG: Uncharacterised protein [Candidatus Poseidoniaceae archaeon]
MNEEGQAGSAFWNITEEGKSELHNELEKERHGSHSREISYGEIERLESEENKKQTKLNNEWKDKVPDDLIMMRDEIRNGRYVILGCIALYLLMTITDGDASPLSPLQQQIWPLVIVAILLPLQFLVSRQLREVRWYAEEMTAVVYRKGLFGHHFVVSATILERGDELILNSETIWTEEGYDDDGHPVKKRETLYWVEVHRGGQRFDTFGNDWNNKRHLVSTIDFIQQKVSG